MWSSSRRNLNMRFSIKILARVKNFSYFYKDLYNAAPLYLVNLKQKRGFIYYHSGTQVDLKKNYQNLYIILLGQVMIARKKINWQIKSTSRILCPSCQSRILRMKHLSCFFPKLKTFAHLFFSHCSHRENGNYIISECHSSPSTTTLYLSIWMSVRP